MKDLFRQLTIVGVLGSTILSPTLSWSERIHEDLKVSRSQPLSHHEEHILTSTAVKVLRSIVQARTAIHDHHMSQAETDLHQAQTLIALVKEPALLPALGIISGLPNIIWTMNPRKKWL